MLLGQHFVGKNSALFFYSRGGGSSWSRIRERKTCNSRSLKCSSDATCNYLASTDVHNDSTLLLLQQGYIKGNIKHERRKKVMATTPICVGRVGLGNLAVEECELLRPLENYVPASEINNSRIRSVKTQMKINHF